jgi:hypothetical protein
MTNQEYRSRRHERWCEMSRGKRFAIMAAGALFFIPTLLALFSAVTMWLWNWLMPTLFKLPAIGFWQAVGILLLAQILFKGGHAGKMGRSRWRRERIRDEMGKQGPPFTPNVSGSPSTTDVRGSQAKTE